MIIRSRAPLRLGLAGGGTDISPYCDKFGGAVLNVTIDMYAYCTIEPLENKKIIFEAKDLNIIENYNILEEVPSDKGLIIHKGVYNRIIKDFNSGIPLSFRMTTYSEAPVGSGLGSSSTMVVAILKAYVEWLNLPLGDYEIAELAYEIERKDLKLTGGKQDQFAATFGGFNFIEFFNNERVIVNPLRIKNWIKNEFENSLLLYYTGKSRESATIIEDQINNMESKENSNIKAMHELKLFAFEMKNSLLKGEFVNVANCLKKSWESKKRLSKNISNLNIEKKYEFIMNNGGLATKVSGAGGGGFFMIICDPREKYNLIKKLEKLDGKVMVVHFTKKGSEGWTLY
jgi:D-glycero-alpha-D-manno-heptose-7-phosphate kinase